MDRELRELHRGAREERKRLTPDPEPCEPPRDDDVTRCDWVGCDAEATGTRHTLNGVYMDVCDEHAEPPSRY